MKNEENNVCSTIAMCCQKGGTGKSLLSRETAYSLVQMGYKVLLIDSDPQATTSYLCGYEDDEGLQNLYDEMVYYYLQLQKPKDEQTEFDMSLIDKVIKRPTYKKVVKNGRKYTEETVEFGFDLITADISLADFDHHLSNLSLGGKNIGAYMLLEIIKKIKEVRSYDYIVIDVLPGLNMIAYNAITACADKGGIVTVINVDPSAVKGGQNLFKTVAEIQHLLYEKNGIKHNGILGVVRNEYKTRLKITKEIEDSFEEKFGPAKIFDTGIPSKTTVDKANNLKRSVSEYDPAMGEIFGNLTKEIIEECERRNAMSEPIIIDAVGQEYYDSLKEKEQSAE